MTGKVRVDSPRAPSPGGGEYWASSSNRDAFERATRDCVASFVARLRPGAVDAAYPRQAFTPGGAERTARRNPAADAVFGHSQPKPLRAGEFRTLI
jgi:hypothetical protein